MNCGDEGEAWEKSKLSALTVCKSGVGVGRVLELHIPLFVVFNEVSPYTPLVDDGVGAVAEDDSIDDDGGGVVEEERAADNGLGDPINEAEDGGPNDVAFPIPNLVANVVDELATELDELVIELEIVTDVCEFFLSTPPAGPRCNACA